jgi:hypothetical protein
MELKLPINLEVSFKLTADQLKQLISEATLKVMPGYAKANVTFEIEPVYDRGDEIIGDKLKGATVTLNK